MPQTSKVLLTMGSSAKYIGAEEERSKMESQDNWFDSGVESIKQWDVGVK